MPLHIRYTFKMISIRRFLERFNYPNIINTPHIRCSSHFYKEWAIRCNERDFAIIEYALENMDICNNNDQDMFIDVIFTLQPPQCTFDADYVLKVDGALSRVFRWVTNMFWDVSQDTKFSAILLMSKIYIRMSDWYKKLPFDGLWTIGLFADSKFHMTMHDWCVHFIDRSRILPHMVITTNHSNKQIVNRALKKTLMYRD